MYNVIGKLILILESMHFDVNQSNFAQKPLLFYYTTNAIKCEKFYKIVPTYICNMYNSNASIFAYAEHI